MKNFKGKAIYNPSGKAGEYSYWACNFYTGCSNGCDYCYLKKGILAKTMGGSVPVLKKCFKDEEHALEVFEKELMQNLSELKKHGLFFSFTTDPMLDLTMDMTLFAMKMCIDNCVKVKVLTKNAENPLFTLLGCNGLTTIGGVMQNYFQEHRKMIACGFTLTGHDELEPNASTNVERIEAMKKLQEAGFRTWASIEPIIDFEKSLQMLWSIRNCCDLVKVGLESGRKYDKDELLSFMGKAIFWAYGDRMCVEQLQFKGFKIYFKDSLLKQAKFSRDQLSNISCCVGRDYNIFNNS